jgi:hypothetical protein
MVGCVLCFIGILDLHVYEGHEGRHQVHFHDIIMGLSREAMLKVPTAPPAHPAHLTSHHIP